VSDYEFYIVNAFGVGSLSGNPAGVCILDEWLATDKLLCVAQQANLPETAFLIPTHDQKWAIRWFSVKQEIDLCGHATLAAAHCVFNSVGYTGKRSVWFSSNSGSLEAKIHADKMISISLPVAKYRPSSLSSALVEGLGAYPESVWSGANYLCLFDSQNTIESLQPDFKTLMSLSGGLGVVVTAPSTKPEYDFVSRYFAPRIGIDEDHATGSAHCMLFPFWSNRLSRSKLDAFQASPRGGRFRGEVLGEKVRLRGNTEEFLKGTIRL
jgi:PhzF family phenazine biosynthesis protein